MKILKKTLAFIFAFSICLSLVSIGFAPIKASAAWSHTSHNNEYVQIVEFYYPPTCITKGYYQYTCTICGESHYENIDALGHEAGVEVITQMPTCTQDGQAVTTCKRCGAPVSKRTIAKTGHDSGVWKVDFEPTAEHDGQMSRYCKKCGQILETKSFSAHTHSAGYTATLKEATCTQYGQKGTFCGICNACYETVEIAPTGHTNEYGSVWAITNPPTCTADGEKTAYCATCGTITATDVIEKLGHDDGIWCKNKIADCTSVGENLCYCTRCGIVIDKETIEALGHAEGTWMVTKNETCTEDGEKVCKCERCGNIIDSEVIPASNHDDGVWKIDFEPSPNIVDENGEMYGSMSRCCTLCGYVLEQKTFTSHTHSEGYKEIISQPGCTTEGKEGTFCDICGAVYETENVASLGHVYSDFFTNHNGTHTRVCERCRYANTENCSLTTVTTTADCINSGYSISTCSVCNYTFQSGNVSALGHTYGNWSDCGDGVRHERVCSECGDIQYEYHMYGDWKTEDNRTFWQAWVTDETISRTCVVCGAKEYQLVNNSSIFAHALYPIYYWLINFIHKVQYTISLDWLFPWVNIPFGTF